MRHFKAWFPCVVMLFVLALVTVGCAAEVDSEDSTGSGGDFSVVFSDGFNADPAGSSDWTLVTTGNQSISKAASTDALVMVGDGTNGSPAAFYSTATGSGTAVRVTADFRIDTTDYPGEQPAVVVARAQQTNKANLYACGITTGVGSSAGPLMLLKRQDATDVSLTEGGTSYAMAAGDGYKLVFTVDGSTLTCTIRDGDSDAVLETITASDTAFTGGYNGIVGGDGSPNDGSAGGDMLRFGSFNLEEK